LFGDHPCNRGFPALSRPEKGGNGMNPEGFVDSFKDPWSWYHEAILSLKILMSSEDFQNY